ELLARIAQAGADVVAMEVSSHALAQERVSGCTFAAAAFTNLTRDHLDYHGTIEAYFEAKARLFRELLPEGAPAVLNLDDAGAPGRLERVPDPGGRVVLVDYAHTDDALARVLDAVRAAAKARVICVFGCGGDRDRGKRPLMGQAAARRADLVVATSDNPRTEDPLSTLAGIEPGLAKHKRKMRISDARAGPDRYCIIPDRPPALR